MLHSSAAPHKPYLTNNNSTKQNLLLKFPNTKQDRSPRGEGEEVEKNKAYLPTDFCPLPSNKIFFRGIGYSSVSNEYQWRKWILS
ncbi:hypothetical protein CEXT_157281 [Caerostris extrusa]|uniref:Uncharacterized protein n=1 Tax=Caerostris extrusa TaxID=172846 RepID=A0AAV4NHH7_CAEEX|nr:hypothetical protein CEXT_157281 [Caerostris extrusa]